MNAAVIMINFPLTMIAFLGDVNVLQNQSVAWSDMPIMIIRSLVFAVFILAPIFNKPKDTNLNVPENQSVAS